MPAFSDNRCAAHPYRYRAQIRVHTLVGGIPSKKNIVEGWLKTKTGIESDDLLREMVAKVMLERGVMFDEAMKAVIEAHNVNGFMRDPTTLGLYLEGRCIKAAIKEYANSCIAVEKLPPRGWGATKKWLKPFIAEHVFIDEDRIWLGRQEPDETIQKPMQGPFGSSIKVEEVCHDLTLDFTVKCDFDFDKAHPGFWETLWLHGEMLGIGASRSQGYGRFVVERWDADDAKAIAAE